MKKIVIVMIVCLILSGCRANSNDITSSQNNDENQIMADIVEEATENIKKKYNQGYSLDKQYIEEFRKAKNNSDMSSITDKYSQLWLEKANEYSTTLSEDIKNTFEYDELAKDYIDRHNLDMSVIDKSQEQWKEYAEKQIENQRQFAELIYMGGTATASAVARYKYDLYRTRAVELYEYCTSWGVEVSPL